MAERNKRLCSRGWSRLYLHNASPNVLEGSSVSATVAARTVRAQAADKEEPVFAEEPETRQRAKGTTVVKKASAAAREEARRAVARASVMAAALKRREDELEQLVREQRKHRAIVVVRKRAYRRSPFLRISRETEPCCREGIASEHRHPKRFIIPVRCLVPTFSPFVCPVCAPVQITRVCRDRDRPLLSLGWNRLCLRAAEGVAAVGVTATASVEGQAEEVAVVARITKERAQEEAVSNSILTENHRHRLDNDNSAAREEQERRTKRLVSKQRLRYCRIPKNYMCPLDLQVR